MGLECVSAELACFLRWVVIGLGPFLERFLKNGRREREVVTVVFVLINALESEMGWYVGLECVSAELGTI